MADEQTFDELKAEIDAEETDSNEIVADKPVIENDKAKKDEVEEVVPGKTEDPNETEDYLKPESHEPEVVKEKKYTGTDIGRAKYKATLKAERKSQAEIDRLTAENEELRRVPAKKETLSEPSRDDFKDEYGDVNDGEYIKAYTEYSNTKNRSEWEAERISTAEQAKFDTQRKQIESSVEQHYDRVEKLATDSDISAEVFRSADLAVREMVDSVFPESGDMITDKFISELGKGSEKVITNLGINKTRLAQFKEALEQDTSGSKAWLFLGKLSSELSNPSKRKTSAPAPASKASGDASPKSLQAIERDVEKALEAGDIETAFNLRDKAKKAGAKLKRLV